MLYIYDPSAPHLSHKCNQVQSGQSALCFSHPDTPARGPPLDLRLLGASLLAVKTTHTVTVENETMPILPLGREPLDKLIAVRLTATEKERLLENAYHAGLGLSEYTRRRLFGRRVIAQADAVMVRELRRIGGLLKHIHNETQGRYSQDTADALRAVKAYIEGLTRDHQKG